MASPTSVRPWTRPHDWAEVVLGVVALLSPIWMDTDNAAMWTMIVLGALVALDGLASLAVPGMVYGRGDPDRARCAHVRLALGDELHRPRRAIAWSSWIIGALTVVVGAVALPVAQAAHRAGSGIAGQH